MHYTGFIPERDAEKVLMLAHALASAKMTRLIFNMESGGWGAGGLGGEDRAQNPKRLGRSQGRRKKGR